uniref:CW domain-containing protein n=1 Tax=Caenorhabditis tropicalis TaxID=1561998 RepID=A0A1I7T6K7_9PELO
MMVTNGQPTSYSTSSHPLAAGATWDECLEYCYNLGTCIVVFDNNCQMFEIGQITTATKTEGLVIAFKVLATDTCPVEDTGTFQGYYATNSTYRSYNVSYNAPIWTFQAGRFVSCPYTWFTLFVREKGPWCMKVFQHSTCCDRKMADLMCETVYLATHVSGVENQEEYDFIAAALIPIFQNISGGPVGGIKYTSTGVWVNGDRTSACTGVSSAPCNSITGFQFSDPTLSANTQGYNWLSAQPDMIPAPANGIIFRMNGAAVYGMDDTDLMQPTSGSACWKGYVCGIKPS